MQSDTLISEIANSIHPMQGNDRTMNEEFLSQPVLVYGPRKGGTSLLQNLIDGGSCLLMMPGELKLKVFVRKPERARADPAGLFSTRGRSFFPAMIERARQQSLATDDTHDIGGLPVCEMARLLDVDEYAARIAAIRGNDVRELLQADAIAFASALRGNPTSIRRWASKEVGGNPTKILELFCQHFPQGQVVLAVRQPEFIIRSIIRDRKRKGVRMSIRSILHECQDAQRILRYAYERGCREHLVVAYEQLTADVAGEMGRICQALGIPFEEVLTKPTTLGEPVVVDTSSQKTKDVFRQPSSWRKDLTCREVTVIRCFQTLGPIWYAAKRQPFVKYDQVTSLLDAMRAGKAALSSDKAD